MDAVSSHVRSLSYCPQEAVAFVGQSRRSSGPSARACICPHRRTRGIPNPIHAMISRWISLLPPPKVKITADR